MSSSYSLWSASVLPDGSQTINSPPSQAQLLQMPLKLNCNFEYYLSLSGISLFADQDFAAKLKDDLNKGDDGSRQLKEISSLSANQLFSILGLDDPQCDKNGDKVINGDELKCLNYAWKAFVPKWSLYIQLLTYFSKFDFLNSIFESVKIFSIF